MVYYVSVVVMPDYPRGYPCTVVDFNGTNTVHVKGKLVPNVPAHRLTDIALDAKIICVLRFYKAVYRVRDDGNQWMCVQKNDYKKYILPFVARVHPVKIEGRKFYAFGGRDLTVYSPIFRRRRVPFKLVTLGG